MARKTAKNRGKTKITPNGSGSRGRPPLPESERLCRAINLRVTPDQLAAIEAAAEKRGISPAVFIRRAAVRAAS